jgi:glycosyltransferase involved in cell wall biosynthesis
MNRKKVLNIIYSGTGGHGSVWYSMMQGGGLREWNNFAVFYGIEKVIPEYISFCEKNNIQYIALKKKRLLDIRNMIIIFLFIYRNNIKFILSHQPIHFLVTFILKKIGHIKKVIFIQHTTFEIMSYNERLTTNIFISIADHNIFLNDKSLIYYSKKLYSYSDKMILIPNGVDHITFNKNFIKESDKQFKIGMISRMSIHKDFDTLILAFKKLNLEYPDINLSIGGDGPEKEKILKLIKSENLVDKVSYLGLLNQAQSINFYRNIDIFILSSKTEAFGMVILEAMACGIPVIGSNVNGVNFIIKDNVNGLLFEMGNVDDLVSKILLLKNDAALRKKIADAGYITATQTFSMENMFNNYNNLLN